MVINAVMWNPVKTFPVAGVTAVTENGNGHPGSPIQLCFSLTMEIIDQKQGNLCYWRGCYWRGNPVTYYMLAYLNLSGSHVTSWNTKRTAWKPWKSASNYHCVNCCWLL